jgi:DUF1680 family protein
MNPTVVMPQARLFPLSQIRLLEGPFRDAMLRDADYLLSLECDRLLHTFRQNVNLPSSVKPLGGWEDPHCELRGHSLGHYLSALSLMFAATGDPQFKQRADDLVSELARCQSHSRAVGFHEGYLSAFPESFIDRVEQGKRVWAPWYTLHKIMAGLLNANQLCGNEQALAVLEKMAAWVKFRLDRMSPEQMQNLYNNEHGGMNEVLADLYAVTGHADYLRSATAFNDPRVFDPLARGEDKLDGLHANTQIPKVIGAMREYELTGDPRYLTIADTFWDSVVLHRSYVIGGHGDREHFFPTNEFAAHLSPDTCETCNTYNMLKLTRELFSVKPDAAKMDFCERALFNHILASQDTETGMFVYLMSLKPGHFKVYSKPEDSFWCCVGTGMENHAKYGDMIYAHDTDSLYVNLLIASELNWDERGIVVRQETGFPESDTTVLKIKTAAPVPLTMRIRRPAWAVEGVEVTVNGRRQTIDSTPGSYLSLTRVWHGGDAVSVRLPMKLRTECLPGTSDFVALLYGPIVLAGELGDDAMPSPFATHQTEFSNRPAPSAPIFASTADDLQRHIKPVSSQPLTFRTDGIGRPTDVTLVPFYKLHRQRYSVYWQLISEAEWNARAPEIAAEEASRMAEEARLVDVVRPGEPQSETDHHLQCDDSVTGDFYGHKWRQAAGWFSYDVGVLPDQPQVLIIKLRGNDTGARTFDVLLEGKMIATQVNTKQTSGFYEAVVPLPLELTKGRNRVTLKCIAHPNNMTGAVYELKVLLASNPAPNAGH